MAIDNTGISSLDTGASDITYTGNEGPKSPQEEQQMMMAQLEQEYEQYRMEQMEIDPSKVLSFQDWYQATYEASRQGVAGGGIARLGYRGGQLVQPGLGRPGYQGDMPPGVRGRQASEQSGGTMGGYSDAERYAQRPPSRPIHHDTGDDTPVVPTYVRPGLGPEPKDKTILEKTKDTFLGPSKWLADQVSTRLSPYYIQHALEGYRKKMGYDHPMLYDEEEGDDFIKQALIDIDLAKEGDLSNEAFEKYMPPWQLAQRYPDDPKYSKYRTIGGEGGPYYPRDVHPGTGTGGITDATGTEIEPIDEFPTKRLEPIYADGGRVPAAYGGIMGDDGRRAYGLGSIFKKAKRAIKKVAKSDIGKMALLAGVGYLGGGGGMPTWMGGKGLGGFQMKTLLSKKNPLLFTDEKFSPWKGIGLASALPLFMGGDENEDEDKTYQEWLAEKNRWLGQIGEFPVGRGDPLYQRNLMAAQGGRIGYKKGGNDEEGHRSAALSAMYGLRKNAQEGGLMDLGGMEKDYRQEGGFVPLGGEERADDVPARLSKNEFVFTADAVRAAGGGDIDAGAEVMENVMENLEQGGQVSEESQGLEGARDMFATSQRLEGVM